jgi:hypothetical protein
LRVPPHLAQVVENAEVFSASELRVKAVPVVEFEKGQGSIFNLRISTGILLLKIKIFARVF